MMYLTASLPLAFVGPGAYSLDGRLGLIGRFDPATAWMVIGAAVALAVVNVGMRRVAPAPLRTHG